MDMREHQLVAVLVDGESLEIGIRKQFNGRIDFRRLMDHLKSRAIARALYFRPSESVSPYLRNLVSNCGFQLISTPQCVDSLLASSALSLAEHYKVIILVGATPAHISLIQLLQSRGASVEVWSWETDTLLALAAVADTCITLNQDCVLERRRLNEMLLGQAT